MTRATERAGGAARALALLSVAVSCLAVTACGDSENEPAARETKLVTTIPRDFGDPREMSPDVQIKEALSDLQADFASELSTGVCSELSKAGLRKLTGYSSTNVECDRAAYDVIQRTKKAGIKPRFSTVLSIDVEGRRATALVQEPGGKPYRVPFVKEEAGWRVLDLEDVEPVKLKKVERKVETDKSE